MILTSSFTELPELRDELLHFGSLRSRDPKLDLDVIMADIERYVYS